MACTFKSCTFLKTSRLTEFIIVGGLYMRVILGVLATLSLLCIMLGWESSLGKEYSQRQLF